VGQKPILDDALVCTLCYQQMRIIWHAHRQRQVKQ
jgi:hypothetical protein